MIKVVVISDGVNFRLENFDVIFVPIKEIPPIEWFYHAESIDKMWQNRNSQYLSFLEKFKLKYGKFDILISDQINPFHPEWLCENFPETIKIYGMIDDPTCTYHRTLSSIWAFDGVFYVSPSYSEKLTMRELLEKYNSSISSHFLPHARLNYNSKEHYDIVENSFNKREKDILYVGAYYESKIDRLIAFKEAFKSQFDVFGFWPYKGFRGVMRALEFKKPFNHRVPSLTEEEKFRKFLQYKICLNFNWNESRETGNMRMYQAPFHGMMLLNDIAAKDEHLSIYSNDEAVFFTCIDDAIEKAKYYLKNDSERIRIAKNGFIRATKDYNSNKIWLDLLNWSLGIRKT